jgi:hypothetical protein
MPSAGSEVQGSKVQGFRGSRFRGSGFGAAAGLKSDQSNRKRNSEKANIE